MSIDRAAALAYTNAAAHYQRGELAEAERGFAEAVRRAPGDAKSRNALGIVVAAQDRVDEAIGHFRAAVEIDPQDTAALTNLADAALNLGRLDEGRLALESGLRLAPDDVDMRALLAETLAALGLPREALPHADRWCDLAPDEAQAHRARATLALRIGEYDAALAAFRKARELDAGGPEEHIDLQGIAACLEFARFEAADDRAEREIVECLAADGIESQTLARAAADLVCVRFGITNERPHLGLDEWAETGWTRNALLATLLERAINVDARLERALVAQRRLFAEAFSGAGALPAEWRRLAAAMATQCFLNEHAWPVTTAEAVRGASYRARLDSLAETAADAVPIDLVIATGLYSPLATLSSARPLSQRLGWPDDLGPLVTRALDEPLADEAMARIIPRAPIEDPTSRAVREQYEESPYPRWVDLPAANPEPLAQQLGDLFPSFRMTPALEGPLRILVAGCGSGRHPLRVARDQPGAEVVAIDLSVASLAYAARRAAEIGVDNVDFRQLDILDVRRLGGDFQVIESSGVVHHMRDPAAGLAALAAKLRPGGVLKLGLYSRRARRLVTLARERIAERGLDASSESIRAFRAAILDGAVEGLEALGESSDLYALSACRDLLFHVQEHQFSPLEIGALLQVEGLVFLGFQLPTFAALEAYRREFPDDETLDDLASWDRFEEAHPGTFANTFQLWCQKPE